MLSAIPPPGIISGVVTAPNLIVPQAYPPPGAVMAATQPGVVTGMYCDLIQKHCCRNVFKCACIKCLRKIFMHVRANRN